MPRFFESNTAGDAGYELSVDEVVARFWQSDTGEEWASSDEPERLDRCSSRWIMDKLGSTDRETLDELLDAIYDGRPKR